MNFSIALVIVAKDKGVITLLYLVTNTDARQGSLLAQVGDSVKIFFFKSGISYLLSYNITSLPDRVNNPSIPFESLRVYPSSIQWTYPFHAPF